MGGHSLRKYIGRTVVLIYMDGDGSISQRRVRVDEVNGGKLRGYCLLRRSPRLFRLDRILALRPDRAERQFG